MASPARTQSHIAVTGAFRLSYPAGWNRQEGEGVLSLWKSERGGAITVSSVVSTDPSRSGNALEHCTRFAGKHAFDPPRISGDQNVAEAAFTDQDGAWCKVRILAAGPRMVLGTYHATLEDALEEAEADGILASLALA